MNEHRHQRGDREGRGRIAGRARGLGLGMAVVFALAACGGRERPVPPAGSKRVSLDQPAVVEIDLSRGLPESSSAPLLGPPSRRTHAELVRSLRVLAEADSSKGFLVRLGTSRIAFARAHEIGRILGDARKAGRPVVCHADEYNNSTLLLAAVGCSKLWVSAAGQVDAIGIAAQLIFARGLLDKLNISADFLQIGKFKGANEPFTREGPSPEARQSLETALGGIRAAWISGIVEGRGKPELQGLLEDGPFAPEEAKAKGLVDEVSDLDDAREAAKKLAGAELIATRFGGSDRDQGVSQGLLDVLRTISGASAVGTPHVTIVPAMGGIAMSAGSSMPFGGSGGIGERELGQVLTRLTRDDDTKAVVLRLDSPGGSALASDLLWKKLMKLRKAKPLVISIGGMAASGGYYLASAGSKIFAEPTSIIGSIGVVSGKLAVGKALAELGVSVETIAANPDPQRANRATYMSAFTPWDEPTRARVLASMEAAYDLFLARIAEGRGVGVDAIAPSAEGRLFGGAAAKERGLVDELGGLEDAVTRALELAKLPKDAPVEIEQDEGGLLDMLTGGDAGGEGRATRGGPGAEALAERARRVAADAIVPSWLDAAPELGVFIGSMGSLLSGERTLAALPFVVSVQ